MTYKEIQELIKLIDKSNLAEVKVKEGDFEISIRSVKYYDGKSSSSVTHYAATPAPAQVSAAPPSAPQGTNPTPAENKSVQAEKPAEEPKPTGLIEIKSPMVGTFYRSSSPDKPPFLQVGDIVEEGFVVCIVEAMKLFNEIESDVRGKVVKVLVDDASPVEYDQPLFLIDPNG